MYQGLYGCEQIHRVCVNIVAMPELPEVETTRRGIAPHLEGETIKQLIVRQPQLRWPVPQELPRKLKRQVIERVERRGKYLLFRTGKGTAIGHLGMSGSMRVLLAPEPPLFHDHVDWELSNGKVLRYTDPRRFGALLWTEDDPQAHPLIASLGPEPLSESFDADYLYHLSRGRKASVKQFLMDAHVVVGVGNIYANESLFRAGIHPKRAAGRVGRDRYERLVSEVKQVLGDAIEVGGTTLRDFTGGDGKPGYFVQSLNVYGRGGQPCRQCTTPLLESRLGQRQTVYCKICQR